jgi:spermidine synthase
MDPRRVPPSQVDAAIAARVPAPLSYYDGETHAGMFCLPKHIRAYMKREDRIIEDNAPLFSFH